MRFSQIKSKIITEQLIMSASVLNYLKTGDIGICEVQTVLYDDFTLTLMSKEVFHQHGALHQTLGEVCSQLATDESYRPEHNDLVAAESPKDRWQRANILSIRNGMYHVSMFDIGQSQKLIKKVVCLPKEFVNIPQFGVRARVEEYFVDKSHFRKLLSQPDQSFSFRVVHRVGDVCIVNLMLKESIDTSLCQVSLSPWVPKYEDRGLECLTLKNGEPVEVLSYSSSNGLYVRSMDEVQDKLWQSVIQRVGAHCFSEKDLDRMPDKGELLACKYSWDKRYYRAVVIDFEDEEILVSFVDFGTTQYVTRECLKPLSQPLKEIPCTAVLVKLKAVEQRPLTRNATRFLDVLVARSARLTVTFETSYSDGVELRMENKRTVSEELNKLLTPSWKDALETGKNPTETVFFREHIHRMSLPKDKLVKLMVTYVESSNMFWACPFESDVARYVFNKLPEELAEFCKAHSSTRYVPRQNEICIAKCNEDWCRAVCKKTVDRHSELQFIDYGDSMIVEHSRIRKMCIDFVWHKSVAVLCTIDGVPDNLTDDVTARLKELIYVKSVHAVKVNSIEEDSQYQYFNLDMPHIIETLVTEGLLTSSDADKKVVD